MKKVCVVVGVGPGNGASLSRLFDREGYAVAMLARNAQFLNQLSAEIPGSLGLVCDVCDPAAIEDVFATIRNTLGEVDTLI